MPKGAPRDDASVVKGLLDGVRVDGGREGQRLADDAVLALGDQLRLPPQAKDLPGAQGEGRHGDQDEDEEAGPVAAAGTDEGGGVVEDGVEVGVVGGLSWSVRLAGGVGEGLVLLLVPARKGSSTCCLGEEGLERLSCGRGPWEPGEGLHLRFVEFSIDLFRDQRRVSFWVRIRFRSELALLQNFLLVRNPPSSLILIRRLKSKDLLESEAGA